MAKLPDGLWLRGKTYYSNFRPHGELYRKRLSRDLKTAKLMLNDLRARADKVEAGVLDNDYDYAELKTEFLTWAEQCVSRPEEYVRHLETIEKFRAIRNVREITPAFVMAYRKWRTTTPLPMKEGQKKPNKVAGPRTANIEINTLKSMLSKAVKPWRKIAFNPLAGVEPLKVTRPKKVRRSLTVDEVKALFASSPDYLKPVFQFFMRTGVRKNELVSLLFTDIDFKRCVATIRPEIAKNDKERDVPLDDQTMAIVRQLRDTANGRPHVFASRSGTPLKNNLLTRFYAVAKKAGIEDGRRGGSVDLHSLRVSFVTISIDHGANVKAISDIVGHSTLNLTLGVYTRANAEMKRNAVAALPF